MSRVVHLVSDKNHPGKSSSAKRADSHTSELTLPFLPLIIKEVGTNAGALTLHGKTAPSELSLGETGYAVLLDRRCP